MISTAGMARAASRHCIGGTMHKDKSRPDNSRIEREAFS